MTAKIINLGQYRSCVRAKNGVPFPQIYRLTGFYWDITGSEENMIGSPSDRPSSPIYTLSDNDGGGIANPTWTAITHFEPNIDDGWLIVRHHMTDALVEGYLDASMDATSDEESRTGRVVYRTKEGLFTLLHRRPLTGAPDHLIMYVTKTVATFGPHKGDWFDSHHIVHPDGSVSDDLDAIYYPDQENE